MSRGEGLILRVKTADFRQRSDPPKFRSLNGSWFRRLPLQRLVSSPGGLPVPIESKHAAQIPLGEHDDMSQRRC